MRYILLFMLAAVLFLLPATSFGSHNLEPEIDLDLSNTLYTSGEALDGTYTLNISTLLDISAFVHAKLSAFETKRYLTDLLEDEGIVYTTEAGDFELGDSSSSLMMTYPAEGAQLFFFKLPSDATVTSIDMGIKGLPSHGSYPSFVQMDVGLDHHPEWSYVGTLAGYGSPVLPSNLHENENGGVAGLTDQEIYYCEIIDLPRARDYTIHANYRKKVDGGNIRAVIFSLTQGSVVKGQGGADSCTLPAGTSALEYSSCEIHLPLYIEGKRLVCVFNGDSTAGGSTATTYHEVKMDDAATNEAYLCGELQGGTTTCQAHDQDFYIKISPGNYSGDIVEQVDFEEGFTEFDFSDALNDYLDDHCTTGDCPIPVQVTSESGGSLLLDNLNIRYTKNIGGSFSSTSFYEGSASGWAITSINRIQLNNASFVYTFSLDTLGVFAPAVTTAKNYTLFVSFEPGHEDNATFFVNPSSGNANGTQFDKAIIAYKTLLTAHLNNQAALLEALGKKQSLTTAIQQLNTYLAQYNSLNQTNQSNQDAFIDDIKKKTTSLVASLPKTIVVTQSYSTALASQINDITDDVVLPDQHSSEAKDILAAFQNTVTIEGKAQYFIMTLFDGTKKEGTLITKTVSSPRGNAYLVEVIPSTVASNAQTIQFAEEPEIVKSSQPVIARWLHSTLSDTSISYVLQGDQVPSLEDLVTLVIPSTLPTPTEAPPVVTYTCGDGICTVLETDEGMVALETAFTCPQDCARKYPWGTWLVTLLVLIAIMWYLNFYHGKYNFNDLLSKILKKKKMTTAFTTFSSKTNEKKTATPQKLFVSSSDEKNVISYIENALKKGFSKSRVSQALLGQGWTREQVEYAFRTAKK